MTWNSARLSDIAKIDRSQVDPGKITSGTKYLGLEHIEAGGRILGAQSVQRGELKSSKFQFSKEHVLYGKLRPYLAKISLPDFEGICSTDILPVRPGPELDRKFLAYYLRQPSVVQEANGRSTGANLPRLSPKALAEMDIPCPPIDEQRRIAEILDKADAIRRKREKALDLADEFLKSAYVHIVGHLNPEHADWEPLTIEQLAEDRKGSIRSGPFGSALRHGEFVDAGIAVLGIDNAVQNKFAWGGRRFIAEEKYEDLRRYRVFPNDVIVTIMGTTGRSAVVPEDIPEAITTKHLAAITCETSLIDPEVLSYAIHSDPKIIQQVQSFNKGAIMDGLNLGTIRKLVLNRPPIEEQQRFVSILKKIRAFQEKTGSPEVDGSNLFQSLSQRAFRGEL